MKKIISTVIVVIVLFAITPSISLAESRTFTSSGTFTVPTGVSSLTAVVVGGGGGGGGGGGSGSGGGSGGGGGGYSVGSFSVTPGSVYTVIVGPGGVPGGAPSCNGASSSGGAGGYSLIGPVVAYGGGGGQTYGPPGYGGYGTASYGYYGFYSFGNNGGAGGASGSGGAGGAGGGAGDWYSNYGVWAEWGYAPAGSGGYYGGGGGGSGGSDAGSQVNCYYGPIYGADGAQGVVVVYWTYDAPTASAGVSANPVAYGSNPGFTLYSTNAYYCYLLLDWTTYLVAGYTTSGTYYAGAFTTPGAHTISAYCYNPAWVGSGWSTTNFTVSAAPPSINNVTISSGTVVTNGVNQYTITSTATDTTGGSAITDELALINYQGVNAGTYRGYLGWSSVGFTHFGGAYKTPPIACSGGGLGAIYNGYGPEYINLISCSTSVSGNVRTVSYVVTFNTNFTSPINSNTISGYATNATTGQYSGWSPFSAFTITPTCSNGANNYPTCNTCSTGFIWQSSTSSCIPSTPPTTEITSPAVNITIFENQNQQFTGTATDADGTVVAYEWRTSNCSTGTIISSLASFVRTFTLGTYTVYLRAQDDAGAWSTNCPSRTIQVLENNPVAGVCGSANGVPTQIKPSSNLCSTVGLPAPVVLPDSNLAPSWSWTCAGEYGGLDVSCGTVTSCGDGKCQPSKGESPATCRADCRVNVIEF